MTVVFDKLLGKPLLHSHIAELDTRYLKLSGGTMTGALVITPAVNGTSILNVTNTAGASVLKVDTTNGRVGIGTTSPTYKLDVNGDIRIASGSDLYIGTYGLNDNASVNSGASLVGLYDDTMAYVAANTNVQGAIKELDTAIGNLAGGTSGLWLLSGSNLYPKETTYNVGIGTTNPNGYKLNVAGNQYLEGSLTATGTLTSTGLVAPYLRPAANSTTALQLQNAAGASILNVDTTNQRVGIGTTSPGAKLDVLPSSSSETVFRTKSLQSTAPLGSELVGNGSFTTNPDTSWTWGTGWTHDTTNFEADHTTGNTAALTQSINVTNGTTYQVEITIKNRTAGSVSLDVNGIYIYSYGSTTALNANTTYKLSLVANITGAATLSITPTTDFNGSVDNITVKPITSVSQPNFALLDDAGSVMAELRGKNSLANLALGTNALRANTTGAGNSAVGYTALYANTTGTNNSALGAYALRANTTGYYNSAMGAYALPANTTGAGNSALGANAGRYISGGGANQTSNNSLYLGYNTQALASGDTNEIVIGASTVGFGSNSAAYGNASMTKHIFQAGNVGISTTAPDYKLDVNGAIGFTPGSSVAPVDNGDVVIEATDDTTLTFKLKGSDGTVRSATLALT